MSTPPARPTRYEIQDPLEDILIKICEIDQEHEEWQIASTSILERLHFMGWRLRSPKSEAMALSATMKKLGAIKPDNKITDPDTGQQARGYIGVRLKPTSQPTFSEVGY